MPSVGSKRVFAIYKDVIPQADGIHLQIQVLITHNSQSPLIDNLEAVFQPGDALNVIATVIRDICRLKANSLTGDTYINNQIFLPSYG